MSLGGTQTSSTKTDPAIRDASLENIDMARAVSQLGYVPYKGATVAGFSPQQIAAMEGTNMGAAAFGLPTAVVPTGEDLSPYGMYLDQLESMAPGQRAFIESLFIDPVTGAAPTRTFGSGSGSNGGRRGGTTRRGTGGYGGYGGYGNGSSSDRSDAERSAMMVRPSSGSGTGSFGLPNPSTGNFAGFSLSSLFR